MRSAGTGRVSWDGSSQPVRGQPGWIESAGTDRVSRYAVSRDGSSQLGRIESAGTRSAGTVFQTGQIGLSVGIAFASAASNSGLNRSSSARNVSNAFRISMPRSCTVWHALSSVDTLEKLLEMFVMRRFAVVQRTITICSRSYMVAVGTSQRAVEPLMVKIRDRSTVRVQITSGSPIIKTVIK